MSDNVDPTLPYPSLTPLHEDGKAPVRKYINTATEELTENAMSYDSTYGNHGHAFLTMPAAAYQVLHGDVPFQMPQQPTINPVHANFATATMVAETNRQHKAAWTAWNLLRKIEKTLRKQLLDAGDSDYFAVMKVECSGFASRSVLELLEHLMTTYGQFTDKERREAMDRLNVPWEGGPLEAVIKQIKVAADAITISDDDQRNKLYDLINDSNLMPDPCQRWRMKPDADKTYASAKEHFQKYASDRSSTTSGGAGLGAANHVQQEAVLEASAATIIEYEIQMANQATTIGDLKSQPAAQEAALRAYQDAHRNNNRNNYCMSQPCACWFHFL
jgi:hypothetical protein